MRGSEIILPGSVDNHMEIGCVFVRNNQTGYRYVAMVITK